MTFDINEKNVKDANHTMRIHAQREFNAIRTATEEQRFVERMNLAREFADMTGGDPFEAMTMLVRGFDFPFKVKGL